MLEGELSLATVRDWLVQSERLLAAGQVDLSAVTRIDSAGVALLLELTRRAARAGRELRFVGAPPQVRGLLEFLQVDRVLPLS